MQSISMKKNIILILIACIAQLNANDRGRPRPYIFVHFNSDMSSKLTGNMSHVQHGIYHELCNENVPYYIVYKNISDQHAKEFEVYKVPPSDLPPRIYGPRYQYGYVYDYNGTGREGAAFSPEKAEKYCEEGHLKEEISAITKHSSSQYKEKTKTIKGKIKTIKATNAHRTWYSRFMDAGLLGMIGFGGYSAYSPSKPAFIAAGVSAVISISSAYGESHCSSKLKALKSELSALKQSRQHYETPQIMVIAKSSLPYPYHVDLNLCHITTARG